MSDASSVEVTVEVASTIREIAEAREFQAARYFEVGFIESLPESGVIDDEWVECSEYHVARDAAGNVVGVCRFVSPSDRQLPMLREFDLDPRWASVIDAHADITYEMGALAVDRSQGPLTVSALLYRQTVRQFRVNPGQVHLLAALDSRVLRTMKDFLHFPFETIGKPKMLVGGESVPVYLYLPAALSEQIEHAPDSARFFSGFDLLDELDDEIIDLRSTYPQLEPIDDAIDLTDGVQDPHGVSDTSR